MVTLNLELPENLKQFAEQQAAEEGFQDTSKYLQNLVEREARRQNKLRELEADLIKGLDSGPPIRITPEYIAAKKAELHRKHGGQP